MFEGHLKRKDDLLIPTETNINIVNLSNSTYLIAVVRDISERKEIESIKEQLIQDLEEKNQELEQYSYSVSHDLKSPLLTIKGFIDMILKDIENQKYDRIMKDATRIKNAANKMFDLLEGLLELSKVGYRSKIDTEISMDVVINNVIELLDQQIKNKKVQIDVDSPLPTVLGDQFHLQQVYQNLIDNAIKYIGTQIFPKIKIGYYEDSSMNVFYIKDNGMGIPKQYFNKIFQLFNQIDSNIEGTGLGLTMVKRIIEKHGGRIWLESVCDKQNSGTTFYFSLPKVKTI